MSDHRERACWNCGSLLHHEDRCPRVTNPDRNTDYCNPEELSIMNQNLTELLVIQDRSGSMHPVQTGTIEGFNGFLADQQKLPGDVLVTLVQFDTEYTVVHARTSIKHVPALTKETYVPRGGTALYDAACRAIDELGQKLAATPEEERPAKVVVMIQTDGEENSSHQFRLADFQARIKEQQDKYNWTFMFFGANIDAYQVGALYGISASTTAQYTGDWATTRAVYTVASNSLYRSRTGGDATFTSTELQSLVTPTTSTTMTSK